VGKLCVNSSWKGPHSEKARVSGKFPFLLFVLSAFLEVTLATHTHSLFGPGDGGAGWLTREAGAPVLPPFPGHHATPPFSEGAKQVPPKLFPLCVSVHLAVGVAQGLQPTTPTVFAGPESADLSPFPSVYGISLLGTTYCV